ncbi:S-layer homology domain-containing protein [Bacillus mycoides]|nr:S-layer homology domain-containing protein [Bacillus mycoides]
MSSFPTFLRTIFIYTKGNTKTQVFSLSRYLWAVKLPPQNSAGAKKLNGSRAAHKSPIGEG